MAFHFINPYEPLGFGYVTCPQDLTNINRYTQTKTYVPTVKTLKIKYYSIHSFMKKKTINKIHFVYKLLQTLT